MQRSNDRLKRRTTTAAGLALSLAALLLATDARAQSPGDKVRIETDTGVVEGTLVDKVPDGYLVRTGDTSQVVPYSRVKIIQTVSAARPGASPQAPPRWSLPSDQPPGPPAPPAPPAARPAPRVVIVPARSEAPVYVPPRGRAPISGGLMGGGISLLTLGILGLVTSAVLLPVGSVMKSNNTCHDPTDDLHFKCEYGYGGSIEAGGLVALSVGAAFTIGGAIMMGMSRSSGSGMSRAVPSVAIGPTGGTATWTF